MKRELMSVLLGASILLPGNVDAQRVRPRTGANNGTRVERPAQNGGGSGARVQRQGQPAPIHASGRIARPVRNRAVVRHRAVPARVVYTSYRGSGFHGRSRAASFRARFGRGGFRSNVVWIRTSDWGRLRIATLRHGNHFGVLYERDLRHVLGRDGMRMIDDAQYRAGLRGIMRGEWVAEPGEGLVLVVSIGHVDLMEFVDFNRDGFVDDVFVIESGFARRLTVR